MDAVSELAGVQQGPHDVVVEVPEALGDPAARERFLVSCLAEAVAVLDAPAPENAARHRRKRRLVQKAREAFQEAGTASIADLCRETGVSAPTLINAFRSVVGETPARFFTLERLARAHDALVQDRDKRSAVKRAALANGFFDLGRFGRYYREIYGVLPSEFGRA